MKALRLTVLSSLLVAATAAPALACDLHEGGGWFMPGSQWRNFAPSVQHVTDSAMDDQDELVSVPVPAARRTVERKRPTFSRAADKANRAARTKVLMMADNKTDKRARAAETVEAKPASEANTQTVR